MITVWSLLNISLLLMLIVIASKNELMRLAYLHMIEIAIFSAVSFSALGNIIPALNGVLLCH